MTVRASGRGYAVGLCLAGAGLALYAATRTWTVDVTVRPPPLPQLRAARTGAALLPWLPPVALVSLAAAGALLAIRGVPRRLLGALAVLAGAALASGAGYGLLAAGQRSAAMLTWPVLCALGGLAVALAGALATARGHRWPALGTRYERPASGRGERGAGDRAEGDRPAAARDGGPVASTQAWDALDRGEDPTVREDPDAR